MTLLSVRRTSMIVLAYLGPLAVIPLIAAREDPEVRWHAWYGLALMVVELAVLGVIAALAGVAALTNLGLGVVLGFVLWIAWASTLAVQLAAMIRALNGSRLAIPQVSAMVDRVLR